MMRGHGYYTLSVQDNLVISHFYGAWNIEQTQNYANHVKDIATTELVSRPWARVVNLTLWEGGGIEVIQPLQLLQQWAEENNCKCIAFVNPPLIPQYMLEKYGNPYLAYKIFESISDATAWAQSELTDA